MPWNIKLKSTLLVTKTNTRHQLPIDFKETIAFKRKLRRAWQRTNRPRREKLAAAKANGIKHYIKPHDSY